MLQNDSVKLSVIFGEPVDQLICGKLKSPVIIFISFRKNERERGRGSIIVCLIMGGRKLM